MPLSVCFLTRNEEPHVERAIASVRGVADEIVVVDTGSSDGTAEAAAAAGAVVVQNTWTDDFAAGRNYTLRQAKGDWVFWMNATEELLPESHEPLRRCMEQADAYGFFVRLQNVAQGSRDPRPKPLGETMDLRLFRRNPEHPAVFIGRLHPHFRPEVVEGVRRQGLQVPHSDVVLRAYLEPGPPAPSKLRFSARLLELELQDRPGQLHYLIEYGRTLILLDDPRAEEVMARAADQVCEFRHSPTPPTTKAQVLLIHQLALPPDKQHGRMTYGDAADLAARWFPSSPNVLWTLAEQAFKRKDYESAAEHLRQLLELGRTGNFDRSHRFDPRILGEDAMLNLGACYVQLGNLKEAEACFLQLASSPTVGAQASQLLAMVQKRMRGS
ncbi:MAG TPA: glycosyltransferase [Tepidisphaeraceae bacterium]|nr:glycosyltransferase [Tepidisphaeraceae bacterium]